jgi:hypothetical protein
MLAGLKLPSTPGDLFVLTDAPDQLAAPAGSVFAHVEVLSAPRGSADWALTALVNSGLLDGYDAILRRIESPPAGSDWSASEGRSADDIVEAFERDLDLGMVVAEGRRASTTPRRSQRGVGRLLRRFELSRPAAAWTYPTGQDYWIRGFLIQGLRGLNLTQADFLPTRPAGRQIDPATFAQSLGALVAEAGCRIDAAALLARSAPTDPPASPRARVVAFYLPQFHPIPENDEWWGPGFTEWTNVTTARPVYRGHYQPRLPQDLGFYDLRLAEVREKQATLAESHGLAGFMYYHYWFAGRRLLERPLDEVLKSDLSFPFCIMWANENWTRAWDGGESHVLLGQEYDRVPAEEFIEDVLPYLRDARYFRVDGRCVISVYRPGQIPGFRQVVEAWRRRAAAEGLSLFVLSVDVGTGFDGLEGDPESEGIDGYMGFPPHNFPWVPASFRPLRPLRRFAGWLYDYGELVRGEERRLGEGVADTSFPGVMVTFDNTARRQWDATVWVGSNPYTFRRWLKAAVDAVASRPEDQRVVFVNAWNEWAEGAILEPTTRFGYTYLQAVRDVVGRNRRGHLALGCTPRA